MKKKLACSSLVSAALVAFAIYVGFGCGTMANMGGGEKPLISVCWDIPPKPFGGVGRDLTWIRSGMFFFVPDIPFSLVGDVLTLPKVLRMSTDSLQRGICNVETLEMEPEQSKIDPSLVLNEIPLGSSIEQAQAVMEKHGFSCTYGSTEDDDKQDQVETSDDIPATNGSPKSSALALRKGKYLRATVLKRKGLLIDDRIDRIVVTFYSQEGKVSDVEVVVRPEGP